MVSARKARAITAMSSSGCRVLPSVGLSQEKKGNAVYTSRTNTQAKGKGVKPILLLTICILSTCTPLDEAEGLTVRSLYIALLNFVYSSG